jgi:hypothetical protein
VSSFFSRSFALSHPSFLPSFFLSFAPFLRSATMEGCITTVFTPWTVVLSFYLYSFLSTRPPVAFPFP